MRGLLQPPLQMNAIAAVLLFGSAAWGQYAPQNRNGGPWNNPYAQPRLSPYLNLLPGGSPSANYYLGVVPERERRLDELRVNQELNDLERRGTEPLSPDVEALVPTLPETGHPTAFMALNPYFGGGAGLPGSASSYTGTVTNSNQA